jgi:hypothetical protein
MLNNPMYFFDDQILSELSRTSELTNESHKGPKGSAIGDELLQ